MKASPAIEGDHDELYDASFDYDQNLEKFGGHYDLFAILDINQDDVPELITLSIVNFRWTLVSVFSFKDGNVVLLKDPLEPEAHGTFEQMSVANGAYTTYICEEGHIHNVWRGTTPVGDEAEDNYAYILDDALSSVECAAPESENTIYFSDIAVPNTAENVDAIIH